MAIKLLSPKQAAEEAGTTTSIVMTAIRKKAIKANKVGWVWTISSGEISKLREFINDRKR